MAAAVAAAGSVLWATPTAAHGLGGRTDLPLPIWTFAYGAAAALLISFAGLAVFWRSTRLEGGIAGRVVLRPGSLSRGLWIAGRAIGLALFVLLVGAAVFGDPDTAENIAPVFVYVAFWVGMTLICALVGDLWRVVNPFDTLAALIESLRGGPRPRKPYRWGRWPAVAALTGFVWLELVYPDRALPRTLAVAVVGYTAAVLVATARWGRDWLRQGEGFTVFFGLLAHMAPLYADDEGRIRARPSLSGLGVALHHRVRAGRRHRGWSRRRVVVATTGPWPCSPHGRPPARSLAVELVNERGGVQGRPVRLELLDLDRGEAAPRALDTLRKPGVDVVLDTYGSTISAPAAAAAQRSGMVLWETGAVGLVGTDAGAGESFFRMAPEAEASGQELVGTFPYSVRGLDAEALVRSIAETRPDVLFVSAYLDDGFALRKAQVSQGLNLKAGIGTSSSYCMPSFAAALGPAAVGLFASDKPDGGEVRMDALRPEGREVLAWGRAATGNTAGGHDPGRPLGLRQRLGPGGPRAAVVGRSEARDVAAAARSVKLDGGTLPNGAGLDLAGPGVGDAGENRRAVSVIWQWVDARTQAVVWPPAFATRPLKVIPIL